jgi:hypothetical protein
MSTAHLKKNYKPLINADKRRSKKNFGSESAFISVHQRLINLFKEPPHA